MSLKVSQNSAVFVPEKCHLSQKKIPENPRMAPEKYGMYMYVTMHAYKTYSIFCTTLKAYISCNGVIPQHKVHRAVRIPCTLPTNLAGLERLEPELELSILLLLTWFVGAGGWRGLIPEEMKFW